MHVTQQRLRRSASQRRIRFNVLVALATGLLLVTCIRVIKSSDLIFRWSMATAYVGLAVLAATLVAGPIKVVTGRSVPISFNARRDLGIWSALLGVAHTVIGLQVHMRGKFWLYFVFPPEDARRLPLRTDAFGVANFTGLAATAILVLLLALSNDRALRALGAKRWKRIQRWSYASFAFVALHGVAYQLIEKRNFELVVTFAALVIVTSAAQIAGWHRTRRSARVSL